MKDFFIVKKGTTRNKVLRPTKKIELLEYQTAINANSKFTWFEDTKHGLKYLNEDDAVPVFTTAYLNYNPKDIKSYIQLLWSKRRGYINAMFEVRVNKKGVQDLLEFSNSIDCILWQSKPRIIVDDEFISRLKK